MSIYKHELTDLEIACGITLEQVAELLLMVAFVDNGQAVLLPKNTSPALGASTARCAFGSPADFVGLNYLGMPAYRRAKP